MRHSEQINEIAPALAKAHKAIKPVVKDATNPHFKNRYATLDAVTEAVRGPLLEQGIVIVQGGGDRQDDAGVEVVTRLLHTSGQWIETGIRLPLDKTNAQGAGSAVSYGRRYGLAAICGLTTDDDDDGEAASHHSHQRSEAKAAPRAASSTSATPACPRCGGEMWDNRAGKKNPKAPDFRCKDNDCKDEKGFTTALWERDLAKAPVMVGGEAFDEVPLPEEPY